MASGKRSRCIQAHGIDGERAALLRAVGIFIQRCSKHRFFLEGTLPETKIALGNGGWETTFLLGPGLFSGAMLVLGRTFDMFCAVHVCLLLYALKLLVLKMQLNCRIAVRFSFLL